MTCHWWSLDLSRPILCAATIPSERGPDQPDTFCTAPATGFFIFQRGASDTYDPEPRCTQHRPWGESVGRSDRDVRAGREERTPIRVTDLERLCRGLAAFLRESQP